MNGDDPAGRTLGVIAGGGPVPLTVAAAAEAAGRPVCIFAITGEADRSVAVHRHHWIRWGEIGRLFDLLAREKVGELVIAGSVTRPDYRAIRVDLGAVLSLPKILSLMVGGDDTVLRGVVRFFEDRGYTVIGAHEVAPDLVGGEGVLGKVSPDDQSNADIQRGFEAAEALGRLDIGQAVVSIGGRVVGVEGIEGTDELLTRIADLRKRGRIRAANREGVLVKAAKPQQDLRVDMPTIGARTLELVSQAGLAGIAVEAGRVMIVDKAALVTSADRMKLFVVGTNLRPGDEGGAP
jgi:DUF1009 family protein